VKIFTSKKAKFTVLSLPVDSLPRSKKHRILATVRGRKFDAKADSYSNWCMCHLPKEATNELKLKNNEKVRLKLVRVLVKRAIRIWNKDSRAVPIIKSE
jgi:hypothetical protein